MYGLNYQKSGDVIVQGGNIMEVNKSYYPENMKKLQKTKNLGYPERVKLKTRGKKGMYSGFSAKSSLKANPDFNTENLLEKFVEKRNTF